jgi:hypothetical protein
MMDQGTPEEENQQDSGHGSGDPEPGNRWSKKPVQNSADPAPDRHLLLGDDFLLKPGQKSLPVDLIGLRPGQLPAQDFGFAERFQLSPAVGTSL